MGEEEYVSEYELLLKANPADYFRISMSAWNKRRNLNWDD